MVAWRRVYMAVAWRGSHGGRMAAAWVFTHITHTNACMHATADQLATVVEALGKAGVTDADLFKCV
jgi:hypothetical protein